MAGDGVSLPTTIAQMGSVAKTQARGQQGSHPATPFADQLDKKDDLKVKTVKETAKTDQQKINPDEEKEKDRRRRRRMKRKIRLLADEENQEAENSEDKDSSGETTGTLIDLRA